MDQQAADFLKNAPDHPMRSRLEPHRDFIRELRRKRYPYRRIVTILREQFAVATSKSALHDFVKVRARNSSGPKPQWTLPPSMPAPSPDRLPSDQHETATIRPRTSFPAASQADQYAIIEELKRRKRAPSPPEPKPKFHYEEGEPLRLIPDPNKDK